MQANPSPPRALGRVIILHEWDGHPYFQALDRIVRKRTGSPPEYREMWVIRQLGLGLLRRKPALIGKAIRNLIFFLRSFALKDATILVGMSPFDPSVLFWGHLRARNRIFYHTSWLDWQIPEVPKRPKLLAGLVKARWRRFVEDPRVNIISVLKESRAGMLRVYRKPEAAFVAAIPHAVDLSAFRPPADPRPEGGPLRVIYLGRLHARKGIDVVAELIGRADPARFRFAVAGEGPEWSRLEPLRDRFEYHGFVAGKPAVAALLGRYDVLILPSHYEQFGIAFIEAMACGVVCIASTGLFPKDLIVNGENGFVVARTCEAFLGALEGLEKDRSLLERFRAKGLERVQEFDVDALGLRWEAALLSPTVPADPDSAR